LHNKSGHIMGWPHIARLTQRVGLAGCTTRTASTNGIPPPDLPPKGYASWASLARPTHGPPLSMRHAGRIGAPSPLSAGCDARYTIRHSLDVLPHLCPCSYSSRDTPPSKPVALISSPAYARHRLHQTHRPQMATRRVDVPSWRVFVTQRSRRFTKN